MGRYCVIIQGWYPRVGSLLWEREPNHTKLWSKEVNMSQEAERWTQYGTGKCSCLLDIYLVSYLLEWQIETEEPIQTQQLQVGKNTKKLIVLYWFNITGILFLNSVCIIKHIICSNKAEKLLISHSIRVIFFYMNIEGSYFSQQKVIIPQCWKMLAHTFFLCKAYELGDKAISASLENRCIFTF